jgi:hypothetical protein
MATSNLSGPGSIQPNNDSQLAKAMEEVLASETAVKLLESSVSDGMQKNPALRSFLQNYQRKMGEIAKNSSKSVDLAKKRLQREKEDALIEKLRADREVKEKSGKSEEENKKEEDKRSTQEKRAEKRGNFWDNVWTDMVGKVTAPFQGVLDMFGINAKDEFSDMLSRRKERKKLQQEEMQRQNDLGEVYRENSGLQEVVEGSATQEAMDSVSGEEKDFYQKQIDAMASLTGKGQAIPSLDLNTLQPPTAVQPGETQATGFNPQGMFSAMPILGPTKEDDPKKKVKVKARPTKRDVMNIGPEGMGYLFIYNFLEANMKQGKKKGGGDGKGFMNGLTSVGGGIKGLLGGIGGGLQQLMTGIGKGLGGLIQGVFEGIGKGLKALSDPKLFIGVGVLIALAGAIAVSALAFQLFGDDINWPNVLIGVGVLALMALGLYAIGNMASQMLLGSLAILAVSASLLVAGFAFGLFSNIDWGNVFIGLGALAVLAIAAIGLSFVAPMIFIGAAAIGALGAALIPAAIAFMLFAPAVAMLSEHEVGPTLGDMAAGMMAMLPAIPVALAMAPALILFAGGITALALAFALGGGALAELPPMLVQFTTLDGPAMMAAAGGITAIAGALAAFGGGSLLAGLGSALGNFFGGDPLQKFADFAKIGPDLATASVALQDLMITLDEFQKVDKFEKAGENLRRFGEDARVAAGDLMELKKSLPGNDLLGNVVDGVGDFFNGLFGGGDEEEQQAGIGNDGRPVSRRTRINDGLVYRDGTVVQLHPDDNIYATQNEIVVGGEGGPAGEAGEGGEMNPQIEQLTQAIMMLQEQIKAYKPKTIIKNDKVVSIDTSGAVRR